MGNSSGASKQSSVENVDINNWSLRKEQSDKALEEQIQQQHFPMDQLWFHLEEQL